MKLTNQTLINSVQGFNEIMEKELPYSITLKISKNIKKIQNLLNDYNEEFNKLSNQYFEKDEKGNYITNEQGIKIKDNLVNEYAEKINILNSFENEIELYMIDSNDLKDIKLSPKALLAIEFIINEQEEEE